MAPRRPRSAPQRRTPRRRASFSDQLRGFAVELAKTYHATERLAAYEERLSDRTLVDQTLEFVCRGLKTVVPHDRAELVTLRNQDLVSRWRSSTVAASDVVGADGSDWTELVKCACERGVPVVVPGAGDKGGTRSRTQLVVPLRTLGAPFAALVFAKDKGPRLSAAHAKAVRRGAGELSQLIEHALFYDHAVELQWAAATTRHRLARLASRDELTGVWNRHAIEDVLEAEARRANRDKTPLSVFVVDIDHFAEINDAFGYHAGDDVLREVAVRILSTVRAYDAVGRLGGEEFLIVLSKCDSAAALAVTERLCDKMASSPIETREQTVQATISVGMTTYSGEGKISATDLLTAASRALEKAKSEGRNRIEFLPALA